MAQNLIPGLQYLDAPAAIAFLCEAFGFKRHAVYADDADPTFIHHAQLVLEDGMVMLGSHRPSEAQQRYGWLTPEEAGGVTMSIYVYVPDPDAHCAVARAAGAEIIDEPRENQGYPGRGYTARDPGGYIWSFGSYDPWVA
jgi:uncharacterized glyoxalase superfamily protein PhnB